MITERTITICGHGSGNPSLKNLYSYNSMRYNTKMSNGERRGVIEVRRLRKLTDTGRKKFVDKYKTILGRNIYSNSLRQYVYSPYSKTGKYYSDCSSSGAETFRQIGYKDVPLLNTRGFHQSDLFETVPVKIVNGHITNPEILKIGDAILYVGNIDRPMHIGHVEFVYKIEDDGSSGKVAPAKSKDTKLAGNYITTTDLNLRNAPGTKDTKVIAVMREGAIIRNYGFYTNVSGTKWLLVTYTKNGKTLTGHCSMKYLKKK